MEKYLVSLEGISCKEWKMLKMAMDRCFEQQKSELERQLKFADSETAMQIIRSQFGQT